MILDFNTAARQQVDKPTFSNPALEFIRHIQRQGFESPGDINASGKIVRFGNKKECWYVFHDDNIPAGAFGSWREGDQSYSWSAKSELEMTPTELHAYRVQMDRIRSDRAAALEKARAAAAVRAEADLMKSEPLEVHPYLSAKGVQSHGARLLSGRVFLPAYNAEGQITTYQTIGADGEKRFLPDGQKKGSWYTIPGSDTVGIAEGYATAATVHEAMGWTMLVAFDAGNLIEVARAYRAAHPTAKIIICGDNDIKPGEKNAGKEAAEKAGAEISAKVMLPSMDGKKCDWNDLGHDEARKQLTVANSYRVDITKWDTRDIFKGKAPEIKWLVEGVLPLGTNIVLAAEGGCGKGYMTLDLALRVAGKPAPSWDYSVEDYGAFGNKILAHGPVIILTAEDDLDEMHRRFEAVDRKPAHPVYILPLPNISGPMPLFNKSPLGTVATDWWSDLSEQVNAIKPLLVIIDPMAAFVLDDINKDPAVGQWVQMQIRALATSSGACILINHHMSKTKELVTSREMARGLVRGTTAIVDGARGCYVLWQVGEKEGKSICRLLHKKFVPGLIVKGCLVKNNFPGDTAIKTYIRNDRGVLVPVDAKLDSATKGNTPAILDLLVVAIADAASAGHPFQATGTQGLYERREQLPMGLRDVSKRDFESYGRTLLDAGRVVKCAPERGGKSKVWLDVPNGPFSSGVGELLPGNYEGI
jgi:phage/plasmid primase-like uncharacterized protein